MSEQLKSTILLTAIVVVCIAGAVYQISRQQPLISEGTRQECRYGADLAKKGFQGTEFENWNFYHTCVVNIVCSNPDKACPIEQIHQETKDWGSDV